MGADSTLVNAAFKESESKYAGDVIDTKPLYDSNAAINTKATNLILGAIDIYSKEQKVKKDGMKAQLDIFNQNAEAAKVKYYKNGEPMEQKIINATHDKIKKLQADFELVNTFGKNDNAENERARTRLNAELKQIVATLNYNRTGLMKLDDYKGNINTGTVKTENLIAFNKVLGSEYDEVGFDESNNLLYTIYERDEEGEVVLENGVPVSKSYTFQQLEKGLPMLDKTAEADDIAQMNANGTKAQNDGASSNEDDTANYNYQAAVDNYLQMINSKQRFSTIANNTSVDGNLTFKQSLEKNQDLFNDLVSLNAATDVLDELDGQRDGKISGKDATYIWTLTDEEQKTLLATNIAEVIAILTDEDHKYFDFDRSKKLLANYKADLGKEVYDRYWQVEHDKKYPKPSGRGQTDYQASVIARNKEANDFLTKIRENFKASAYNHSGDFIMALSQGPRVVLNKIDGVWTWEAKNSQGISTGPTWPWTKPGISSDIEAWLLKN
jgi:hypothetical protein